MKGLFYIILALMIGLSLCACGEKEVTNQDTDELSKGEKLYKRYKNIIELLEEEDYAGALS